MFITLDLRQHMNWIPFKIVPFILVPQAIANECSLPLLTFALEKPCGIGCPIANFCSLHLFSFGQALGKLQGKVLTHSEKVGWWKSLMVECVSIF